MDGISTSRDRLLPFLLMAAAVHGALLFSVYPDTPHRPRALPQARVLAVALEARSAKPVEDGVAQPSVPVPAVAAVSGSTVTEPAGGMPNRSAQGAAGSSAGRVYGPSTSEAHQAGVTRTATRQRAAGVSDDTTGVPAQPAPISAPADGQTPSTAGLAAPDGDAADPTVPDGARLTAAVLDRQISEWTAAYTAVQSREATLPTRTAYVEKVREHRYAADAYERAWQDKVERVGNMNYPEEARRKNLSGGLLLSVGVNADGTLQGITVHRSSGHQELDEAAMRIVRLAAPFSPFPSQLKKDYDVLVITRTWRFFTDHRLATAP